MVDLNKMSSKWVASLPVWRDRGIYLPGLTPESVAQRLLLPRVPGLNADTCDALHRYTSSMDAKVHSLLETQRALLTRALTALSAGVTYGLSEARSRAVPVSPIDLTRHVFGFLCGIDDDDPLTGDELAAAVSTYLDNWIPASLEESTGEGAARDFQND